MIKENLYTPGRIRTFTGKYVSPILITPDQVDIIDIAHSLSMQCRFGGHARRFYSVAQHSVHVADLVNNSDLSLAALLHDASEAYMVDLPKPIKELLPDYVKMENRVMSAIGEKFGIPKEKFDSVKEADRIALEYEWESNVVAEADIRCWSPSESYQHFIDLFKILV